MPALYEQLGRLDCLGAAASMRRVREQGAYTKLHDTFHHPVGGGSAELAIGNWMLAFCAVLIEPSVSGHWTGKNDDAAGSFVESWIVTLRQAGDANSRSLLEEFVRFGELAHRLIQPLCQVKQIYDLLDWRKGRRFCLSLLDQLASSNFAGPATSDSALAVARSAPGKEEEEVQGHWGTKEASEPLEVLAKTARALGEVATEAPNAVAVAVSPGTLEAEVGIEEPDWSGDETPNIPVTIAKTEEDEEMPATDETAASGAPKRPKRVVLATGQLALLRALAAANASNWADFQRTLKEAPGDAEDKEDLVNNLTDLATTFAKNRAECSKAAALKAEKLADLEGEEAEYLAALPPHLVELERKNPVRPSLSAHLGWVEHDRFKRDVEAAGVWMARRREKSRLRAAKHRASKQAETAGNTAQDPVADRADAGDHLSFQLGEAARESLREFRAELRAGALDTPFRAGDAPKRKPESSRRRKIKWQRFSKRVKSKYDPRESEQNHPYAHISFLGSDSNPFGGPTLPWLVSSPAKFNPTDADRNHPFAQATCLPEDAPTSLDWERGFHWGVLCALFTGLLVWALTWTCRRTCCRSKEAATSLEQPPRHLAGTATFATPKSPPALPPWVAPGPRQPIPSPPLPVETVLVTTTRGKAYHRRGCIHVRGHETRTFRPCLVCQPHVLLQEEDTRARLQAFNHDDAQRDTNHAIAHLAWWLIVLLVMGTSLGCFAFSSWVRPWRVSRPAQDPTYLKVGSLEKRVRFSLSPDSGSEAEREKAVVPESAAAQASLTTRHHRKRGRHPLVASQGSSPSAAKRAHPDNGPQAGVLPANAWARESLRLVRDHLSPTTQRLYDSHWRWWELFTRRRGVSALRTVDRFDPGEEELFLDYLVYLFVGQGLAAATAQARLGAIRSVHLQLGFPDPLKPLPRLLLALEGIRRRRGPSHQAQAGHSPHVGQGQQCSPFRPVGQRPFLRATVGLLLSAPGLRNRGRH